MRACVLRWCPQEVTLVGPRAQPAREQEALFPEEADGSDRASSPVEGLEHQTDGVLDLDIGIEADRPFGSADQADRRAHPEFTASRLVGHRAYAILGYATRPRSSCP
jgi:hypothetical protein